MTIANDTPGAGANAWSGPDAARQARAFAKARRHSRFVRLLRYALPAFGLALLAGMLASNLPGLLLRGPITVGRISVDDGALKMENPRLTGYTRDDKTYELTALSAAQDIATPGIVRLNMVEARITAPDGGWTTIKADRGLFQSEREMLDLESNIVVRSDSGQAMRLDTAQIELKAGTVVSRNPVELEALNGTLRADTMQIADKGERMTFTGHVVLVFRPKTREKAVYGQ